MPSFGTSVIATPAAASGAAYATFHTGANRRAQVVKLIVTNTQTVFSQVALYIATNTPVATTSTTPQPYDAADATSTAALDTAWSTAPTVGTVATQMYAFSLGGAQGSGLTDTWRADAPIVLAKSAWLVLWNIGGSAGGALTVTIQYLE
jgi:hypothetical protein